MKTMRKFMAFLIATIMMASNIAPAFASTGTHKSPVSLSVNNTLPVTPAKPPKGESAGDFIKNPRQPEIYTLRTDYKVKRGDKNEIDYQPYIASVGENATPTERAKIRQKIKLPDLAGYDRSMYDDHYLIDYETVKKAAEDDGLVSGNEEVGIRKEANQEFVYKPKDNTIKVKHVFQDLNDFTKYTNPNGSTGEDGEKITEQSGNTGSTMEVIPLPDKDIKGFVPERKSIGMQVPEKTDDFILEYRYNRAHFDVTFDSQGGTDLPSRTLYYEQIIPKIDKNSIPTKDRK